MCSVTILFSRDGAGRGLVHTFTKRKRTQGHCAFTTRRTQGRKGPTVTSVFLCATSRRQTRTKECCRLLGRTSKAGVFVSKDCPMSRAGALIRLLHTSRRGRRRRTRSICPTFTSMTGRRKFFRITTAFRRVTRVRTTRDREFHGVTSDLRGGAFCVYRGISKAGG